MSSVFISEEELAKELDTDYKAYHAGTLKTYSLKEEFAAMDAKVKELKEKRKQQERRERADKKVPVARLAQI